MRILTAVIGIPVAIYIINYGTWIFAAAVALLALSAWHEFSRMMCAKDIKVQYNIGFFGVILVLGCAWLGNAQELIMVMVLLVLLTMVKTVLSHRKFGVIEAAVTLLGTLYISLPFAHLILLRFTEQHQYIPTALGSLSTGAAYLWLAFVGTWASDTLAYFVGSVLGRHKLCPAISPGKTYEGAAGGLVGSIAGVTAMGTLCGLPITHTLILGFLVGIAAPLGDLTESALKRFTGVKDSGNVLPGHGGVLDRFDAIMFAVPVVYYYIRVFIIT
ncbi:phosphatidate cytidylyltransferase [Sporomusa sp.]|uniref:phosphatidate cytidylyltransferase n=1 Tax=Sporomusa sp. TaxID=2078658 RepID=UPI002D01FE27|nr:phosphatidate cytidylyltransferase [Sporomusa sp.]HWR43129.1 phosphatidate cytidylyltransferase [Sporomusa sp.]